MSAPGDRYPEAIARVRRVAGIMCTKCEEIEREIRKFLRFIAMPLDCVTTERLKLAVEEMETTKASLHSSAQE